MQFRSFPYLTCLLHYFSVHRKRLFIPAVFQYWSLLPKLKNQKKSTKKKSEREGEEIATPPYPATKTIIHQRLHRKPTTKEAPIWRQTSRTRDHVLSCTGERSAEADIRETRGVVFLKMAIYKCPKSFPLFFLLLLAPTHPRHVRRIGHRSHTRVRVDRCAVVLDESEQHSFGVLLVVMSCLTWKACTRSDHWVLYLII